MHKSKKNPSFFNSMFILFFSALFIFAIFILLYYFYEETEKNNRTIHKMRITYENSQKNLVKRKVERFIDEIKVRDNKLLLKLKEDLYNKAYEGINFIRFFNNLDLVNKKKIDAIKERFRYLSFYYVPISYLLITKEGKILLFPPDYTIEGKNIKDIPSAYSYLKKVLKDKEDGLYEYIWKDPNINKTSTLFLYKKYYSPLKLYLCIQVPPEIEEGILKKRLIQRVNSYRYGKNKNGYFFVIDYKGNMIATGLNKELIGRNVLDTQDSKGKKIVREFIKIVKEKGSGFVRYVWPRPSTHKSSPKISFIKGFPKWEWIIGSGLYLDDIKEEIEALQKKMRHETQATLMKFSMAAFLILLFLSIILFFIKNKLNKDIERFTSFFKEVLTTNKKIKEEEITYREFVELARYANEMLEKRNKIHKELENEKEKLEITLRSIGDIVVVVNDKGEIVIMNKRAEEISGWSEEEAKGRKFSEIFKIVNDNETLISDTLLHSVLNAKDLIFLPDKALLISKSGKRFYIEDSAAPILKKEGELLGVIFVFRDVTEKIKLREEILKRERFYSALVEDLPVMVIRFKKECILTFVNKRYLEYFGVRKEEVIGKSFIPFIDPRDQEKIVKGIRNIKKSNPIFVTQHRVKKDGEIRWLEWINRGIFDKNGNIIEYSAVGRDITKEKESEEERIRIQKLESLEFLAAGIAHDFNNILMAIIGNIDIAKLFSRDNEKLMKKLEEIEKASSNAKELALRLLAFSKGGDPVKKPLFIKKVIEDAVTFSLHGSNVEIEIRLPEDLWWVNADKSQISQVIQNLVINAVQAMPDGGKIYIIGENVIISEEDTIPLSPGEYVKIRVKDTGKGISKEHLSHIFDPYFTTKEKGSGLGLFIVYTIIKKHEGYITVYSEEGEGTEFTIFLPAERNRQFEKEEVQTGDDVFEKGKNILVMDDDETIRDVLHEMLTLMGHKVTLVKNGEEAIEAYKKAIEDNSPFDIVIMDLTVKGGMGGKEAAKKLLSLYPDAKIVVSSGYSDDSVMSNYSKYGFKGVLKKPYTLAELMKLINEVL